MARAALGPPSRLKAPARRRPRLRPARRAGAARPVFSAGRGAPQAVPRAGVSPSAGYYIRVSLFSPWDPEEGPAAAHSAGALFAVRAWALAQNSGLRAQALPGEPPGLKIHLGKLAAKARYFAGVNSEVIINLQTVRELKLLVQ